MQVVIQFTKAEEGKALPIILRRSLGMMLRDRIYILDEAVAWELSSSDIQFKLLARQPDDPPTLDDIHGRPI